MSDIDALIRGNYLQQPSPYSWAANQGKEALLMQQMTNDLMKQQMAKEADTSLMRERMAHETALRTKLQQMSNQGSLDVAKVRHDATDDVTEEEATAGYTTFPSQVWNNMPNSQKNKFEYRRSTRDARKVIVKPKQAGGQAAAPNKYDQYAGQ